MNLSTRRKNVRRLAKQFGMQENNVREMLAIESGRMVSDLRQVDDQRIPVKTPSS